MRKADIAEIKKLILYCPNSGIFTWKVDRSCNAKAGGIAGYLRSDGYIEARICGTRILLHRAAWAITYNEWPEKEIDHIDGDKSNNRIVNLRSVDKSKNQRNIGIGKKNKTGILGVYWHSPANMWRAQIVGKENEKIYLGQFATIFDAAAARKSAEIIYGFSLMHGQRLSHGRQAQEGKA